MAIIELRDITKTYRQGELEVKVLKGVNLEVEKGDFLAIMGASGSGKSTLLYIIGCLESPSSGTYRLAGAEVSKLEDDELSRVRNERLGFVFQSFYLIPYLTVEENVLVPTIYSKKRRDYKARARHLLEQVGLGHRVSFLPSELSGGQKQRVAIVRSLINDPDIVLADEPTGQLDSHSSAQVMEILSDLNKQGKTIIVVTHDEQTADYASRRVIMKDGLLYSA
ncbi:MAG: ABC transporter ATP-binding protein [Thermodesulfobacteria bacterium]|nr:ABC transporter ATP-binding protein [Thermodesulfobacteriota bacterium]